MHSAKLYLKLANNKQRCFTMLHFINNRLIVYIRWFISWSDLADREKEMFKSKKEYNAGRDWLKCLCCIAANHLTLLWLININLFLLFYYPIILICQTSQPSQIVSWLWKCFWDNMACKFYCWATAIYIYCWHSGQAYSKIVYCILVTKWSLLWVFSFKRAFHSNVLRGKGESWNFSHIMNNPATFEQCFYQDQS